MLKKIITTTAVAAVSGVTLAACSGSSTSARPGCKPVASKTFHDPHHDLASSAIYKCGDLSRGGSWDKVETTQEFSATISTTIPGYGSIPAKHIHQHIHLTADQAAALIARVQVSRGSETCQTSNRGIPSNKLED